MNRFSLKESCAAVKLELNKNELETIREAVISQLIKIPQIPKSKPGLLYILWLVASVIAFLFIIITYLGIIGGGVFFIYWHSSRFNEIVNDKFSFVVFFSLPLILVIGFLLIIIKPIFNRRKSDIFIEKVTPEDEPFIYAFANEIARITSAPKPKEICITSDVNAFASFRKGFWSIFFPGCDMQLSLGLPLINGLTMPELAGVIAHEFGHFSQGSGMKVSYLLRRFNFWLARIVYERDKWDYYVHKENWVIFQPGIWLGRQIIWLLMMLGNAVAAHLLRQMEYDADKNEISLSGTDCFLKTNEKFNRLGFSGNISVSIALVLLKDEGRLADNWGEFVVNNLDELVDEKIKEDIQKFENSETSFWDSHPSFKDRNKAALELNQEGYFNYSMHPLFQSKVDELKQKHEYTFLSFNNILLTDMEKTSKRITTQLYEFNLGKEFSKDALVPVEEIIRSKRNYLSTLKASKRFLMVFYQIHSILI